MKINFTLLWPTLGGGTKILFRLADELSSRGHDVSVVTMGTPRDIKWIDSFKGEIIRIPIPWHERLIRKYNSICHRNSDFRKKFYLNAILSISQSIPECDINVATYSITAFSVVLSGKGKLFYYAQHYEPTTYINPFFRRIAEVSYSLPLRKILNSSWLKDQIEEKLHIDTSGAYIIPSAVDNKVFFNRPSSEFVKYPGKKRIVCMGKKEDWKGFNDALSAMSVIFNNRNDVEFFVYAFKDNLPKRADVPYVIITDIWGDRLAELLSTADVVIIPSWYESSPLPGLEAMSCGAALVTTRFGTEDFAVDGINSLVVPPKEPVLLANAIDLLLNDNNLREKLIKNGFQTASEFSWDKTVSRVEEIFKHA